MVQGEELLQQLHNGTAAAGAAVDAAAAVPLVHVLPCHADEASCQHHHASSYADLGDRAYAAAESSDHNVFEVHQHTSVVVAWNAYLVSVVAAVA